MSNRSNCYLHYSLCCIIIQMLATSFVRSVRMDDASGNVNANSEFPIAYPNFKWRTDDKLYEYEQGKECLFYAESVSVVVYKDKESSWAKFSVRDADKYKYGLEIDCPKDQKIGDSFTMALRIDGTASGIARSDFKGEKGAQFSVSNLDIGLTFNFTHAGYWELVGATANNIAIKKGAAVPSDFAVNSDWTLASAAGSSINGFKDYSFACSQTNPVVWQPKNKNNNADAVGISFGNMQFNPFNATYTKEGKKMYKFGWKVNDCQPLLSIGTWMGLIVALLLIAVLSFGFLMLNSVQTMDRFDDPKQKQLIINAKE